MLYLRLWEFDKFFMIFKQKTSMSFFSGRNVAKPFMVSSMTMNVFLITQPVYFTSNGNQYYHEWMFVQNTDVNYLPNNVFCLFCHSWIFNYYLSWVWAETINVFDRAILTICHIGKLFSHSWFIYSNHQCN